MSKLFTVLDNSGFYSKKSFTVASIKAYVLDNKNVCNIDNIFLYYTGRLYNYNELRNLIIENDTNIENNYESFNIVIYLYKKYGIENTLKMLDGDFAFILFDNDCNRDHSKMFVAQDPRGYYSLYNILLDTNQIVISSDIKTLCNTFNFRYETEEDKYKCKNKLQYFEPGTYSEYRMEYKVLSDWKIHYENIRYSVLPFSSFTNIDLSDIKKQYMSKICLKKLENSFLKRISYINMRIFSVGFQLSSDINDYIIACIGNDYFRTVKNFRIQTFAIGLADSEDIIIARELSKILESNHTEIIITAEDIYESIHHIIKITETIDTDILNYCINPYLLYKFINENTQIKYIFNGFGSDVIRHKYVLHSNNNKIDYDIELHDYYNKMYNKYLGGLVNISNSLNIISMFPFLDEDFINTYITLPLDMRFDETENNFIESNFKNLTKISVNFTSGKKLFYEKYEKIIL